MRVSKVIILLLVAVFCLASCALADGLDGMNIVLKPVIGKDVAGGVELSLTNRGTEAMRGEVVLNVPRQWGARPARFFAFELAPGKGLKKSWSFASALKNPYNKYTVKVRVSSGGSAVEKQIVINGSKSSSVNLGEPRSSRDIPSSTMGTQTHYGQNWDYKAVAPLVEKAGFKWIRDAEHSDHIIGGDGGFEIPAKAQAWIDDAAVRKMNLIYILDLKQRDPNEKFEALVKRYVDYCAFMAKTLKGKVAVWELWNEPHNNFRKHIKNGGLWNGRPTDGERFAPWIDKFADLTIAAAKAIRKVDPEAVIITGGGVPPATMFLLEAIEQKSSTALFDGVTMHPYPYRTPPETMPWGGGMNKRDGIYVADKDQSYSSLLRCMREKMAMSGMKNTDIYVTEFGYTTFHRAWKKLQVGFSPETQAKYLSRFFMLNLVHGVTAAIQYDFQDDHFNYSPDTYNLKRMRNMESHFGLVEAPMNNYAPKPSFFALQRICSLFSAPVTLYKPKWSITATPERYLECNDGHIEKHIFKNGDNELIVVLWNAIRSEGERQPLLIGTITIGTAEYGNPLAIDIITGETYDITSEVKGSNTSLKNMTIPDYPIVIKMFKK